MINSKLKLYTLQEIAEICHVPLATARYWRSMRKFKVIKVGRKALVLEEDLFKWLGVEEQDGKITRIK